MKALNKKMLIPWLAAAGLLLSACGGSDSSNNDNNANSGTVTGRVVNAITGDDIAGATVITDGASTTTSGGGEFSLNVPQGDRIGLAASAPGFADTQKIVSLAAGRSEVMATIKLLPVSHTETFSGSMGKQVDVPNTAGGVQIAGNSLVDSNGGVAAGDVTARLTIIDPRMDPEVMPGDYMGDGGDGNLRNMESYGAMTATFVDASNAPLNLAAGTNATIRIPAAGADGATLPPTMPLFYYDAEQMKWVQEGTATLVDGEQPYYTGTVGHFSTWNADKLYDSIDINGCVQDVEGNPVANARVTSTGDNYIGTATAYTRPDGTFTVRARQDSSVVVSAAKGNSTSNTVSLYTGSTPYNLMDCLLMGNAQVSIKLTWGENPWDLDSHLFTPAGDHIYYVYRGSLTSAPYANLDVDDTTGFGPEVVTISVVSPGQYRYAVYNYSGTFSPGQTESPARVELSANGRSYIFSPPTGEGSNRWWHVFNLDVANDGAVTVNRINQWSSGQPSGARQHMPQKPYQISQRFDRVN